MWWRSASFIRDRQNQNPNPNPNPKPFSLLHSALDDPPSPHTSASMATINPNPNPISAYYQTRAEHHAVVTPDWLAQSQTAAEAASGDASVSSEGTTGGSKGEVRGVGVIEEFNYWRKKPDLAEAVAAIMALGAAIRSSEANTMIELDIELKKASNTLKVRYFTSVPFPLYVIWHAMK